MGVTPYWERPGTTLYVGDCRTVLATLPAESVQTCITSPPYMGLRDYGTATWEGGDSSCDHTNGVFASDKSTLAGYTSENVKIRTNGMPYRDTCGKCGARRIDQQIGLESTIEEYVAALVAVFREVRRVLRPDGTCWIVIGDAYAAQRGGTHMPAQTLAGGVGGKGDDAAFRGMGGEMRRAAHRDASAIGLKHKDLIGVPWRVAFALQSDGWWLRSDIIWEKPNPMPESVTDRPTRSHEYIFLLTKSARYWYDGDAIREPYNEASIGRYDYVMQGTAPACLQPGGNVQRRTDEIRMLGPNPLGRNKRDVWTITTQSYDKAHFATFPPKLIEPCVLAGCPAGGVVLDPFMGAATSGLVAQKHNRQFVGIELNEKYMALAIERLAQPALPLHEAVTA